MPSYSQRHRSREKDHSQDDSRFAAVLLGSLLLQLHHTQADWVLPQDGRKTRARSESP
jgi:hypothetical protein